jgi:hypothetical protein
MTADDSRAGANVHDVPPRERPPVLIRWIARPDACDECKAIAAGSPYERLPTWPGLGDTACVCRCSVEGARAGNVMAVAGEPVATASEPVPRTTPPASKRGASARVGTAPPAPEPAFVAAPPRVEAPVTTTLVDDEPSIEQRPVRMPSLGSLTSFRVKPLERRWALALGALIFVAAFVALFSTGH